MTSRSWRRRWIKTAAALCGLLVLTMALDRALPLNLTRAEQRGTLLFAADGQLISSLPAPDHRLRFSPSLEAIDPAYLQLLLAIEDKRFYHHIGVDPLAVLRATLQMVRRGDVVSGASTLSMQTVRLLEPRPRTFRSKLIEMLRALQLDYHYSKADILSMYLTLAPYGGRIEGIEAASRLWLGKAPTHLSMAECALLVALPQNPERLRPDRFPDALRLARSRILDRAQSLNLITARQRDEANAAPIPTQQIPLPDLARHLTERLATQTPAINITTTLDATMMRGLTALLARETARFAPEVTLAALVVETRTGQVRAYIGNADYYNPQRRGMIDMIPAIRSPGSTLKPFIYALGFEKLIVHPATIISDTPQNFGDYAPANFDSSFHGDVTIAQALQRSLNLPAVALLSRIGPVMFDTRLSEAGVSLQFDRRKGGASLPIALGGVGLSLESLVQLYRALGNNGMTGPLTLRADAALPAPLPFLTPAAAWYTRHILEDTPRPSGFIAADAASSTAALAYKTGTSYGQRDAWAIGVSGDYTLGIWVGRADGQPCIECIGLRAAAPVLLQAVSLLPPSHTSPAPPAGLLRTTSSLDLPPALRRFSLRGNGAIAPAAPITASAAPPLTLSFPLDGSVIELPETTPILPLRAEGGTRPLTWFVNGAPLTTDPLSRHIDWPVTSPGFIQVTVKDASGASASAETFITTDSLHN